MRRLIQIVVLSIVVILGAVFAVRNAAEIKLDFYFTSFDTYLSLAMIVSVIIGVALGVLASIGWILRVKAELGRLKRDAKHTQQELNNLRTIPIRDDH